MLPLPLSAFKTKKKKKDDNILFSGRSGEKKTEENGRNRKHGLPQNFDETHLFQEYIVLKPDTLEAFWT